MITINTNKLFRLALIAVIAILAVGISPGSAERLTLQPLPAPLVDPDDMGTAFTYQGRLMSGGNPANGEYDFKFELYDDAGDTTETLLDTIEIDMLPVANGLFMVDLDFGAGNFLGFERWLQINVRLGADEGADPYTTLSPRQQINPAPYATFARTIYRKTVVVKPVGIASENGTELLNAMAGIGGATADNPFLLKIEPGIYHIGANSLALPSYVDVEGSGEDVTLVQSDGFTDVNHGTFLVNSQTSNELRRLSIESIAIKGDDYAIALNNNDSDLSLSHVSLMAEGGITGNYGIYNSFGENALENITIAVSAASIDNQGNFGIYNGNGGINISDSNVDVSNGKQTIGVFITGAAILTMLDSQVQASSGGEGTIVEGVQVMSGASALLRNSRLSAVADGSTQVGSLIAIDSNIVQIIDSTAEAAGGSTTYGIYANISDGLEITNSKVLANSKLYINKGVNEFDTPLTIRDSQIIARGNITNIGIAISDATTAPVHDIFRTDIQADSSELANSTYHTGVSIYSEGTVKFNHDTIEVEPYNSDPYGNYGGTGIINNGATVSFENSTINHAGAEAFYGIQHLYYTNPGTFNKLYVNNSEIYTCSVEDPTECNTITAALSGGDMLQLPFVFIGSTLLWGNQVTPGLPIITCMWVHDEHWNGFGWPAIGTDPGNSTCP